MATLQETENPAANLKKVNKTKFILSCPITANAREVVELGKAQGIHFTRTYVNHLRWRDGIAGAKLPRGRPPKRDSSITQDQKELAETLRKLGASCSEIARHLHVSKIAVFDALQPVKSLPESRPQKGGEESYRTCLQDVSAALMKVFGRSDLSSAGQGRPSLSARVQSLAQTGLRHTEIARVAGVSRQRVGQILGPSGHTHGKTPLTLIGHKNGTCSVVEDGSKTLIVFCERCKRRFKMARSTWMRRRFLSGALGCLYCQRGFSDLQVQKIRKERKLGASVKSLAASYGVHEQTMWKVVRGESYKEVEQP